MSGFGRGLPRLPPEYPLNGLRVPWLDAEPPQQTAHDPRRIESRDDGVLLEVTRNASMEGCCKTINGILVHGCTMNKIRNGVHLSRNVEMTRHVARKISSNSLALACLSNKVTE